MEDDEVVILEDKGSSLTMSMMPHQREACCVHPFLLRRVASNLKFCENCFCYICDERPTVCLNWKDHCHASYKLNECRAEKSRRSSPLLKALAPEKRAKFLSDQDYFVYYYNGGIDASSLPSGSLATDVERLRKSMSEVGRIDNRDSLVIYILLSGYLLRCLSATKDRATADRVGASLVHLMFSCEYSDEGVINAAIAEVSSAGLPWFREVCQFLQGLSRQRPADTIGILVAESVKYLNTISSLSSDGQIGMFLFLLECNFEEDQLRLLLPVNSWGRVEILSRKLERVSTKDFFHNLSKYVAIVRRESAGLQCLSQRTVPLRSPVALYILLGSLLSGDPSEATVVLLMRWALQENSDLCVSARSDGLLGLIDSVRTGNVAETQKIWMEQFAAERSSLPLLVAVLSVFLIRHVGTAKKATTGDVSQLLFSKNMFDSFNSIFQKIFRASSATVLLTAAGLFAALHKQALTVTEQGVSSISIKDHSQIAVICLQAVRLIVKICFSLDRLSGVSEIRRLVSPAIISLVTTWPFRGETYFAVKDCADSSIRLFCSLFSSKVVSQLISIIFVAPYDAEKWKQCVDILWFSRFSWNHGLDVPYDSMTSLLRFLYDSEESLDWNRVIALALINGYHGYNTWVERVIRFYDTLKRCRFISKCPTQKQSEMLQITKSHMAVWCQEMGSACYLNTAFFIDEGIWLSSVESLPLQSALQLVIQLKNVGSAVTEDFSLLRLMARGIFAVARKHGAASIKGISTDNMEFIRVLCEEDAGLVIEICAASHNVQDLLFLKTALKQQNDAVSLAKLNNCLIRRKNEPNLTQQSIAKIEIYLDVSAEVVANKFSKLPSNELYCILNCCSERKYEIELYSRWIGTGIERRIATSEFVRKHQLSCEEPFENVLLKQWAYMSTGSSFDLEAYLGIVPSCHYTLPQTVEWTTRQVCEKRGGCIENLLLLSRCVSAQFLAEQFGILMRSECSVNDLLQLAVNSALLPNDLIISFLVASRVMYPKLWPADFSGCTLLSWFAANRQSGVVKWPGDDTFPDSDCCGLLLSILFGVGAFNPKDIEILTKCKWVDSRWQSILSLMIEICDDNKAVRLLMSLREWDCLSSLCGNKRSVCSCFLEELSQLTDVELIPIAGADDFSGSRFEECLAHVVCLQHGDSSAAQQSIRDLCQLIERLFQRRPLSLACFEMMTCFSVDSAKRLVSCCEQREIFRSSKKQKLEPIPSDGIQQTHWATYEAITDCLKLAVKYTESPMWLMRRLFEIHASEALAGKVWAMSSNGRALILLSSFFLAGLPDAASRLADLDLDATNFWTPFESTTAKSFLSEISLELSRRQWRFAFDDFFSKPFLDILLLHKQVTATMKAALAVGLIIQRGCQPTSQLLDSLVCLDSRLLDPLMYLLKFQSVDNTSFDVMKTIIALNDDVVQKIFATEFRNKLLHVAPNSKWTQGFETILWLVRCIHVYQTDPSLSVFSVENVHDLATRLLRYNCSQLKQELRQHCDDPQIKVISSTFPQLFASVTEIPSEEILHNVRLVVKIWDAFLENPDADANLFAGMLGQLFGYLGCTTVSAVVKRQLETFVDIVGPVFRKHKDRLMPFESRTWKSPYKNLSRKKAVVDIIARMFR